MRGAKRNLVAAFAFAGWLGVKPGINQFSYSIRKIRNGVAGAAIIINASKHFIVKADEFLVWELGRSGHIENISLMRY